MVEGSKWVFIWLSVLSLAAFIPVGIEKYWNGEAKVQREITKQMELQLKLEGKD